MTGQIFLIDRNETLVSMHDTKHDSEDHFQVLLANYPDLLAGDQIDQDSPRRWLLVDREVPIPDHEAGTGRWSLDHLFLDQDGIPTIVEVKRASDTRTRREVVGQMLDYAANGVAYWPIDDLQEVFAKRCAALGIDTEQAIEEAFQGEVDEAQFWESVDTNLQLGKVRMVFVVDRVPGELRRIVEFLNEQMHPAEVLAVEIRQYTGSNLRALVPRVIGQTARSGEKTRTTPSRKKWNELRFLEALRDKGMTDEADVVVAVLHLLNQRGIAIHWGVGQYTGTFMPRLDRSDASSGPGAFVTNGVFWLDFWRMSRPPFDSDEMRARLVTELNSIDGIDLAADVIHTDNVTIELSHFATEHGQRQLLHTLDWFFSEFERSEEEAESV